jgi:hypothetical protein
MILLRKKKLKVNSFLSQLFLSSISFPLLQELNFLYINLSHRRNFRSKKGKFKKKEEEKPQKEERNRKSSWKQSKLKHKPKQAKPKRKTKRKPKKRG